MTLDGRLFHTREAATGNLVYYLDDKKQCDVLYRFKDVDGQKRFFTCSCDAHALFDG